jgi:proteasome accessory factor A
VALRKFAGLETEYAVHASWAEQSIQDTVGFVELDDIVLELVHAAAVVGDAWAAEDYNDHTWLPNGGLIYPDFGSHPEYATPETSDPLELVRQHKLGDVVMAAAAAYSDANSPALRRRIFKGNVDAYNNTFGTHESYSISARVDVELIAPLLASFLATRTVFTGVGGLVLGNGQRWHHTRSPRARFLERVSGIETTHGRALVNLRHEPHAANDTFNRLHLICGEANRCDVANFLKIGTTAIALAMIEDRRTLDALILEDPIAALHASANAPTLHTQVRRTDGSSISLLEHQMDWAERAAGYIEKYGEHIFATPETAGLVVQRWQSILQDLAIDPNRAHGKLDWVTKRNLIDARAARDNLALSDPILQQYDLRWGEITEGNLVSVLEDKGMLERLVPDLTLADLTAPTDSRAALRGHLIAHHKRIITDIRWSVVAIESNLEGIPIGCAMDDPGKFSEVDLRNHGLVGVTAEELRLQFALMEIQRNRGFENAPLAAETGQAFLACRAEASTEQQRILTTAVANGMRNALEMCMRIGTAADVTGMLRTFREALSGVSDPHAQLDLLGLGVAASRVLHEENLGTSDRAPTRRGVITMVDRHLQQIRNELEPVPERNHRDGGPSLDLGGR